MQSSQSGRPTKLKSRDFLLEFQVDGYNTSKFNIHKYLSRFIRVLSAASSLVHNTPFIGRPGSSICHVCVPWGRCAPRLLVFHPGNVLLVFFSYLAAINTNITCYLNLKTHYYKCFYRYWMVKPCYITVKKVHINKNSKVIKVIVAKKVNKTTIICMISYSSSFLIIVKEINGF